MNPSCQHFLPLIHQYLDDEITREERADLLAHLDSCAHCRRLLEDYRHIAGELRALPTESPPTLHRDIMDYVDRNGSAPWWRRRTIRRVAALAVCAAAIALMWRGNTRLVPPSTGGDGLTAQQQVMDTAPTQVQGGGTGEAQPFRIEAAPETPEEAQKEARVEGYSYYPLTERTVSLVVGDEYDENTIAFSLTDEERETLWPLLQTERWEVATDLPAAGFHAEFYLIEADQIWFFNQYDDDRTLIVPSASDDSGEKVCYFAPAKVITDVLAYAHTLEAG